MLPYTPFTPPCTSPFHPTNTPIYHPPLPLLLGSRRIELSMLPYKVDDEDEDDYVVEGRDPEGITPSHTPITHPIDTPYHTPYQYMKIMWWKDVTKGVNTHPLNTSSKI